MRRTLSDEPARALRSALASPWPELQLAARTVIRRALKAPTLGEAAQILGIGRRTLERIRAEFPEISGPAGKH